MRKLLSASLALGLALSFAAFGSPASASPTATAQLFPDSAVDRELVTIDMTAEGKIVRKSLVDALSVYGSGFVRVTDLNEPNGLRNLDGFAAPESVSGNSVTWALDVNGQKDILTVAPNIPADALISVTPRYFIAGKRVSASKLVGYSGNVTIEYVLANTSRKIQTFDVTDKTGHTTKAALETWVPLVGQTQFELPSGMWSSIDAPDASIVTDDNNVNHVTFTSILAPLVGTTTQTVRLSGRVKNLEMAETRLVFQPLLPGAAEDTVRLTAEGAGKLFSGVGQIDANLGKLQTGTLALILGLEQLYQGILDAQAGIGSVGKTDTIVDGLKRVLDGLKDLGDSSAGVPAIKAGVDQLTAGVNDAVAGLGSASANGTILNGLSKLDGGLGTLSGASGLAAIKGGIDQLNAQTGAFAAGLLGTAPASPVPPTAASTLSNDLQFLKSIAGSAASLCDTYAAALGQPSCTAAGIGAATMSAVGTGAQQKIDAGRTCLTVGGVPGLCAGAEPNGAQEGLSALSAGTQQAITSIGTPATSPTLTLRGGLAALTAGVTQLKAGLKSGDPSNPGILEGLEAVAGGLQKAIAGIGTVGQANTLTDGADQLFTGTQDLASGVGQLAAGSNSAAAGAKQIGDGQAALSTQGTKALQAGVGDNVRQASEALAVIGSMKQRAANESSLYGPPQGASESSTFVVRVGGISARNVVTVLRFAIAAALLMVLVGAGITASRRTPTSAMA
jgi:X-X-X-Leu-X-X-Gly heptad repeat protein